MSEAASNWVLNVCCKPPDYRFKHSSCSDRGIGSCHDIKLSTCILKESSMSKDNIGLLMNLSQYGRRCN